MPEALLDHRELPARRARHPERRSSTSPALERYTLDLWQAVRDPASAGIDIADVDMQRLVTGGASPRGMSYLLRAARVAAWLDGRDMVVPEDLRAVFFETMAHRIFFDPIYELRREPIVRELVPPAVRAGAGAMSERLCARRRHPLPAALAQRSACAPARIAASSRAPGGYFRDFAPLLRSPDPRRIDLRVSARDPFEGLHVRRFEQKTRGDRLRARRRLGVDGLSRRRRQDARSPPISAPRSPPRRGAPAMPSA